MPAHQKMDGHIGAGLLATGDSRQPPVRNVPLSPSPDVPTSALLGSGYGADSDGNGALTHLKAPIAPRTYGYYFSSGAFLNFGWREPPRPLFAGGAWWRNRWTVATGEHFELILMQIQAAD